MGAKKEDGSRACPTVNQQQHTWYTGKWPFLLMEGSKCGIPTFQAAGAGEEHLSKKSGDANTLVVNEAFGERADISIQLSN